MSESDKTRIVKRPLSIPGDDTTKNLSGGSTASAEGDVTRIVRPGGGSSSGSSDDPTALNRPDDGKTVLIRPSKSGDKSGSFHPMAPQESAPLTEEAEPVVGWLIVLKGPGRGRAVQLGYGWNTIGRDASQRARLDFGDGQISRLNHARLLYDPKSRKFTLTLGESPNPTYLRDEVLLGPTKLENGDKIQFGDTTVLFHALCGADFDWQDME
jgi:hypothetical protein